MKRYALFLLGVVAVIDVCPGGVCAGNGRGSCGDELGGDHVGFRDGDCFGGGRLRTGEGYRGGLRRIGAQSWSGSGDSFCFDFGAGID